MSSSNKLYNFLAFSEENSFANLVRRSENAKEQALKYQKEESYQLFLEGHEKLIIAQYKKSFDEVVGWIFEPEYELTYLPEYEIMGNMKKFLWFCELVFEGYEEFKKSL